MPQIYDAPVSYGAIKAKPTEYNGRRYESKLEARVAEQLDHNNYSSLDCAGWIPQPGPFRDAVKYKDFGGQYTPDFYLPQHDIYLEVCSTWDERHEYVVKTFGEDHTIIVIDAEGRFCTTDGKPEPQLLGEENIFTTLSIFGPLWPSENGETLFEQGIRRKADAADAESIAPERQESQRDYMGFGEFAEKCHMGFVSTDEWGRPDKSRMTKVQAQMTENLYAAYLISRNEHWMTVLRENQLDEKAAILDAIYRVNSIGGQVALQNTNNYAMECRYQNAMVKVGPLVYYPTTGTIRGKKDSGLSGIEDFLLLLQGKTDAEVRAAKRQRSQQ